MPSYEKPKGSEWVQPIRKGYKMMCCDCGLVHTMNFRVYKGRAQFQCFRNNRSTAMARKNFESIRVIKKGKSDVQ